MAASKGTEREADVQVPVQVQVQAEQSAVMRRVLSQSSWLLEYSVFICEGEIYEEMWHRQAGRRW